MDFFSLPISLLLENLLSSLCSEVTQSHGRTVNFNEKASQMWAIRSSKEAQCKALTTSPDSVADAVIFCLKQRLWGISCRYKDILHKLSHAHCNCVNATGFWETTALNNLRTNKIFSFYWYAGFILKPTKKKKKIVNSENNSKSQREYSGTH